MQNRLMLVSLLLLFTVTGSAIAEDQWCVYLSKYDKKPGSTRVDMSFKKIAPVAGYSYVVVTGFTYEDKNLEGFPSQEQIDSLNVLHDKLIEYLSTKITMKYVGTFTHNNEQLHYIYVQSKEGVIPLLNQYYSTLKLETKPYINVRLDPEWLGYRDFLYPSKQIVEFDSLKSHN